MKPIKILVALLVFFTGMQVTWAGSADGLRTTDYFVHHLSKEPFYVQNKLDPNVTLHIREVVIPEREREVAADGKVLLLLHGATFPGSVAFDLDYENVSMMRHFAKLGWDTFTLDLEGYGMSTRPPTMDQPEKYRESNASISLDVTMADVNRAVDFIRDLRGVGKIHLLGWSAAAMAEAPLYAISEPDKVSKLVLYGSNYLGKRKSEEERKQQDVKRHAEKNRIGNPSNVKRWVKLGTKEEYLIPGAFEAYGKAHLASDPKSSELGGRIRAPWGRFIGWPEPHFNATKIKVPTLVIRGDSDNVGSREDNQALLKDLGSDVKKYVEIENAGHFIQFEKSSTLFYKALQDFLEEKG